MKKMTLLTVALLFMATSFAQAGSQFLTDKVGDIVLHTYQTGDPLGDVSFVIESKNSLVILEPVPFEANIKEILAYTDKLNKPVSKILVAFHPGGLSQHPTGEKVISKPLNGFLNSDAGKGMLKHFEQVFKGKFDSAIVPFDSVIEADKKLVIDGVTYQFAQTKLPGMPGSNIAISDKILFSHFAPAANVHPSPFFINGRPAIAAALAESEAALKGGYSLFIGSHMPGKGGVKDMEFQIKYLKTLEAVAAKTDQAADIVSEMEAAFPGCAMDKHLKGIAEKL